MGKKGSKRKTRWRTLSIGAPPGEEDEEDGLRNGYVKGQANDNSPHGLDRSGQGEYKPRRSTVGSSGSSGYANGTSKTRRDESAGSPSQPKIIFNEDEYTRITTPRQDVLFKKGYLSRKKPWAGNASTSATPSTTESQSASHSTAGRDGSETTEDQQLLDRDSAGGEYPAGVDSGAQVGYGTFYDHASGYYYEYPVMLVGPAPIPAPIGPSVLAALPCSSVPLRPIEWINPAFVPKLSGQSYCLMNNEVHYQSDQNTEAQAMVAEEQGNTAVPVENSNGAWNESGTGSASCSGSVAEEAEEQQMEETNAMKEVVTGGEENPTEELLGNDAPYLEPMVIPQPTAIHVPHVIPAVPQPYMYPGHYMFGPPLVNVNGVTIQGGPLIRTTDVMTMATAAYTKRRKKKKRRWQKRVVSGNAENDEEDYSSDGESGLSSSRTSWSTCPSLGTRSITTTTETTETTETVETPVLETSATTTTITNRPLNPECEEFHLRPVSEQNLSVAMNTSLVSQETDQLLRTTGTAFFNDEENISLSTDDNCESKYNNNPCDTTTSTEQETKIRMENRDPIVESMTTMSQEVIDSSTNADNRLINYLFDDNEIIGSTKKTRDDAQTESNEASPRTDINNIADSSSSANEICERADSDVNDLTTRLHVERDKEALSNGQVRSNRADVNTETVQPSANLIVSESTIENGAFSETPKSSKSSSGNPINEGTILVNSVDTQRGQNNSDSSNSRESTRKKYGTKSLRFIREPTPGLNLNDENDTTDRVENVIEVVISPQLESSSLIVKDIEADDRISSESISETGKDNTNNKTPNEYVAEGSNDSGFETQTRQPEYRITEAVTEWLRRANSPDVFITSVISDSSDTEDEDLEDEPAKNLQGNPMPALSVNSMADDRVSSCTASCSEFAKINNVEDDRRSLNNKNDHQSAVATLRRTHVRGSKKRSAEKFAKKVEDRNNEDNENGLLSSSDSCHQQESIATALKKRPALPRKDVAGVCEFTEKDSVAGMRVATSSRINNKRNTSRRARRLDKSSKRPAESVDVKIRRANEPLAIEDEGIVDSTHERAISVKTFEKGEIVVSVDGKFLQISPFARLLHYVEGNVPKNGNMAEVFDPCKKLSELSEEVEMKNIEKKKRSSDDDNEIVDNKMAASFVSIEEPDVLECWEAETIEPIRTPKKMLQSHGVSYEGEAAEEDHFQAEPAIVEHVQKYYRLARESATSVEDESYESKINVLLDTKPFNKSKMVPNSPIELIKGYQGEEIQVITPNEKDEEEGRLEERRIPVDEAYEVYESYYTDKTQSFTLDSIFRRRPLHRQEGEGPVPCRAVCCNIQ